MKNEADEASTSLGESPIFGQLVHTHYVLTLLREHQEVDRVLLVDLRPASSKPPTEIEELLRAGALRPRRGRRGGVRVLDPSAVDKALEQLDTRIEICKRLLPNGTVEHWVQRFQSERHESAYQDDSVEPPFDLSQSRFPADSWQRQVIDYLGRNFTRAELVGFLTPKFQKALRNWRRLNRMTDSHGTRTEIAEALLVIHDRDLLRDCRPLREAISAKAGVAAPGRLHGGKQAALSFVDRLALPRELAGVASPPRPPSMVVLQAQAPLRALEPYQDELKARVVTLLTTAGRGVITLPTGAGKTRMAVEAIHEWLTSITSSRSSPSPMAPAVIWVAHTGELCEQACSSFEDVWRSHPHGSSVVLARYWGPYSRDHRTAELAAFRVAGSDPTVVVTTPQSLLGLLASSSDENGTRDSLQQRCRAVVIDEAHRAATPTYRQLISAFGGSGVSAAVGLTATPFRKTYSDTSGEVETGELISLFGSLYSANQLGENARERLIADGVLARPDFDSIEPSRPLRIAAQLSAFSLDSDIEATEHPHSEQIDYVLAVSADDKHRRRSVFEKVRSVASHPAARMLYFGPGVADAELMAFLLLQQGIPAAAVSSHTRESTRRRLIEEFKSGRIRVLCNRDVLTTGFDAPRVTHVVVARPTISLVLFEQMVGRGLRGPVFGGTESCHIITVEDRLDDDRVRLAHLAFRQQWSTAIGQAGIREG